MEIGASHFLVHHVASQLKSEGLTVFNLGGAPEGSSLARFKESFGTVNTPLQEVSCYVGPLWRRKVTRFAEVTRGAAKSWLTGSPRHSS